MALGQQQGGRQANTQPNQNFPAQQTPQGFQTQAQGTQNYGNQPAASTYMGQQSSTPSFAAQNQGAVWHASLSSSVLLPLHGEVPAVCSHATDPQRPGCTGFGNQQQQPQQQQQSGLGSFGMPGQNAGTMAFGQSNPLADPRTQDPRSQLQAQQPSQQQQGFGRGFGSAPGGPSGFSQAQQGPGMQQQQGSSRPQQAAFQQMVQQTQQQAAKSFTQPSGRPTNSFTPSSQVGSYFREIAFTIQKSGSGHQRIS